MHFAGRTWRPPYEANSVIIQAASGCTYGKCRFCSLYADECFRMSPMEEFEEDLAEIRSYQPHVRRIFWTGANPFAMSYENLKLRALTVRDYLIKCQTMAMFASIRDIRDKEVWQLKKLRAMGVNGLSIGTESGDDDTLALAGKGYTAADILEQCRKLDEAGIEYYFVYMTGLAGKGRGYWNAVNSAELFSRLNPYFISVDSLTLFPDTELYRMEQEGKFIPAGDAENGDELYQDTMLKLLEKKKRLDSVQNTKSYALSTSIYLWKNKKKKYANRMRLVPIDSMDEMSDEGYGFTDYDSEVSPEHIVLKQNEVDMIQRFVKTLPEKYRIPIYLYYSADMQINEVSKILGLPEGTVKSRMRKAKKQLKEKLEAIGYDR